MKEISRRVIKRGILVNNVEQPLPDVFEVVVQDDIGNPQTLVFNSNPTDADILAQVPPIVRRPVRSANASERMDAGAELAQRYLAFRQLTDLADFTTLFSAQERARITGARDSTLAEIKAFI